MHCIMLIKVMVISETRNDDSLALSEILTGTTDYRFCLYSQKDALDNSS